MENNNCTPPQIIKSAEGYNIFYKEKYLYPLNNTLERITSKIKSLDIQENTLIIVPSPLLFYGIDSLINILKKDCSIVFIEQDERLYRIKDNPYPEFKYINPADETAVDNFCSSYDFSGCRKVILLPLNSGYFINRTFYNIAADIFRKSINTFWKNKITKISLSSRWYRNIFKNLPAFFNGKNISELKINKPVFIAGAGESLEKSLPLIKKYRNKVAVVAIDTAVGTLLHYDIRPDFILAVESQFYNIYDFYGCKDTGISVICDISAYPKTARITGGENYFFFSEFSDSSFLKKMNDKGLLPKKIPPLGSVGVIAVYTALNLTELPVFYSGLDFSFIPGKSHSRMSPFIIQTSLLKKRTDTDTNYSFCLRGDYIKIQDINGSQVVTNSGLKSYAASLKEIIAHNRRVYSLYSAGIVANKNTIETITQFDMLIKGTEDYSYADSALKTDITVTTGIKTGTEDCFSTKDYSGNNLSAFYFSEYQNILEIIKLSTDFLNSKSNEKHIFHIKKLLDLSDYILEDFPENSIPDVLTPPYLKRVLLSCYRYERILNQMMLSLKSSEV